MLTESAAPRSDHASLFAHEDPNAGELRRDVFACLYRDAARKQQRQAEAGRLHPSSIIPLVPPLREYLDSPPQRRCSALSSSARRPNAGVRRGSDESVIRPGITVFETSRRIEKLALPRGPANTIITPPSPNYGRLLNFTEESKERQIRRSSHPSSHVPCATIPTNNPTINRLATPRRHTGSPGVSTESSVARERRQQPFRPVNPVRQSPPVFRFK
ncbi:hypothetical protein DQ04_03741040 [Trypanosoma grayi]|uniref:hypothetical protein n=1 Tax=Trypanosoma grayi TaxID=71804 RepID=UPI0004F4B240|nr:hypothetical protein DQ04_03741040 [Trypanosoma grayi]KEG10411.1 hypothetical protein DQ04_03741040 [Trypanosoma grayi]